MAAASHLPVWHLVDCKGKILGKIAQRISIALRGKYKPVHEPSDDCGDYVVVINARHAVLTGKKADDKVYHWHSGWQGNQTVITHKQFATKHPTGPLKKAVWGAMPKNRLSKLQFQRLFVFADDDHPYKDNILKSYV
ncbi:hypothetical protein HK101_002199 [Irineochytrium annulatum]|nr:hypothetical protein HK101_002199 [Irineochytrium annulatum]